MGLLAASRLHAWAVNAAARTAGRRSRCGGTNQPGLPAVGLSGLGLAAALVGVPPLPASAANTAVSSAIARSLWQNLIAVRQPADTRSVHS